MYLDDLNMASNKLYSLSNSQEIDLIKMKDTLFEICKIFKRLPNQRDFKDDISRLDELKKYHNEEYREILESYNSFKEFFILDQRLLLDYKLNKYIVVYLGAIVEELYENIQKQEISENEIISSINKFSIYICELTNQVSHSSDLQIVMEKSLQGLTGISIIVVNLKALPFEIALPGGALLASSSIGLYIFGNTLKENHLFGRICKFFSKRSP